MYLEKESKILKKIGPFEKAQTNLDKFVWNYMVFYTTVTIVQAYEKVADLDSNDGEVARLTANVTMRGVFDLVLERDNGVWN